MKWPRAAEPKPPAPAEPAVLTILEDDSRYGDIQCDGTVHVSGHVEGDIQALRIVVGETGTVDGALAARTVHADGTVNGPIVGGRVTL
ncbi:MAG: polymer-forming cytoskeletal protein, partial [Pseudomonadota bacterium]